MAKDQTSKASDKVWAHNKAVGFGDVMIHPGKINMEAFEDNFPILLDYVWVPC